MKELSEVAKAVWWYRLQEKEQYSPNTIEEYDKAAQLLTARSDFGRFLVEQIGENPGKVLEIASGTGLISQALAERAAQLTCSDISHPALSMLQKRIARDMPVAQANFLQLPFPGSSFDTVVSVGGYRYVHADKRNFFWDEMERVLSSHGKLFIGQFYPRAFKLKGTDIREDREQKGFKLQDIKEYMPHIVLQGMSIRSGIYRSFVFERRT